MLVEFQDGPEAGETEDAKYDRYIDVFDEERPNASCDASHEECRPALHAKVVFALDDEGMEHADTQEGSQAEYDAVIVH